MPEIRIKLLDIVNELAKSEAFRDFVRVVRCKNCIHNEGSDDEPWCRIYECIKSKDGFCDEGVKKEDEKIH